MFTQSKLVLLFPLAFVVLPACGGAGTGLDQSGSGDQLAEAEEQIEDSDTALLTSPLCTAFNLYNLSYGIDTYVDRNVSSVIQDGQITCQAEGEDVRMTECTEIQGAADYPCIRDHHRVFFGPFQNVYPDGNDIVLEWDSRASARVQCAPSYAEVQMPGFESHVVEAYGVAYADRIDPCTIPADFDGAAEACSTGRFTMKTHCEYFVPTSSIYALGAAPDLFPIDDPPPLVCEECSQNADCGNQREECVAGCCMYNPW